MSEPLKLRNGGEFQPLPHNFLHVDPGRLAHSAGRTRGLPDLQAGLDALEHDYWASAYLDIALSTGEEWDQRLRDIRRGGILAYQLAQESASVPAIDAASAMGSMVMGTVGKTEYTVARFKLTRHATWLRQTEAVPASERRPSDPSRGIYGESDDDMQAHYASELGAMVNSTLEASGIGASFDEAVNNLRGEGLELTRPTLRLLVMGPPSLFWGWQGNSTPTETVVSSQNPIDITYVL